MGASTSSGALEIALIGFGEAARAFVGGWSAASGTLAAPLAFRAYDIKTNEPGDGQRAMQAAYRAAAVHGATDAASAVRDVQVVFSFVTAEQAFSAAEAAAPVLAKGALFFDCNSCAPQTKTRASRLIEAAGARYVDAAVMAPVYPARHRTAVLLSGPHADAAADVAGRLAMAVSVVEGPVGAASAIKLVRSIMVKGLEALTVECLLAGRKLGVGDTVLASLAKTFPDFDWQHHTGYMLERAMTHGIRRAAEMREAARMVDELGLDGRMAAATAQWEQQVGDLALRAEADPREPAVRDRHLDSLLAALAPDASGKSGA